MSILGGAEDEGEVEVVDRPAETTTTTMATEEVGKVVIQSATGTGTMEGGAGVVIMTEITTINENLTIGLQRDRVCTDHCILHVEVHDMPESVCY